VMPDLKASASSDLMDHEVDLMQYLSALLRAKYRILIIALVISSAVFGMSRLVHNLYTSSAILAININQNPGGVKPGQYRGSDLLGLIEHDFVMESAAENEIERLIARMTSTSFMSLFMKENNVVEYIYSDFWDAEENAWVDGFEPSEIEAITFFRKNMIDVFVDQVTGLLRINITTKNPVYSADLANKYWVRFNEYITEIESVEMERRRSYLEDKLDGLSNLEMQRSIFRLIETQLASEALLFGRDNYPLEEIQVAIPPLNKSYPNRKLWTVLAFVGTAILSIVFVLTSVVVKNIRVALEPYQQTSDHKRKDASIFAKLEDAEDASIQSKEQIQASVKSSDSTDELSEWIDR